ncbi:MAG TPA: glycerate kinase, partial [Thermoleophilaceae bacterium]|nr:glycerate kinase [Thermoleophilaceae bacterium]
MAEGGSGERSGAGGSGERSGDRRGSEHHALVAPDSFKGTFSAAEVAGAIASGLRDAGREAEELPVADGGEGTMDVLLAALGGERRTVEASDPFGRPVRATFALIDDGRTAIVETAQASGLSLVEEDERDAWSASTRGTGELIVAATEAGAERVIVTVGGSATTDGGAGALEALRDAGVRVELDVLCDVRTPFELAPSVYGPQKGADPRVVKRLEGRLDTLASTFRRDPRGQPMTGAAGGLSGGLWGGQGAHLLHGASFVLDAIGFDERMRAAAFVVTGEGRLDEQTLEGKVVGELATRCRQNGVTCHAIVGSIGLEPFEQRILDLASVTEATTLDELRAAGR